jgi:carbon-monoxide dehydrogenase small subunit
MQVTFRLNGVQVSAQADPEDRLLDVLRDRLNQTGTKEGCGEGECGACTVIVDERAVNSCLYPAMEVEGRNVTTIEGILEAGTTLSAVQQAFVDEGGAQCGFCTPGMIVTAVALLKENPFPTQEEIRDALTGNLCRCTGYVQIVESIVRAAKELRVEVQQ